MSGMTVGGASAFTPVSAPASIGTVPSFGSFGTGRSAGARAEHLFESVVDQRFIHGYPERTNKVRQVVCDDVGQDLREPQMMARPIIIAQTL